MRLDRYLSNLPSGSRQQARYWLARGQAAVDGKVVRDPACQVTPFTQVQLMQETLQARRAVYYMLHKPSGFVSATRDARYPTVMELLHERGNDRLHIAGRLDILSTGLLLITNDGSWSRRITEPSSQVAKVYRVETADPIHPDAEREFAAGIYFGFEDITTRPVELVRLGPRLARLTLHEGRYHQIKRMFGRFRNRVVALHRERIGAITLDSALRPGDFRCLTDEEVRSNAG